MSWWKKLWEQERMAEQKPGPSEQAARQAPKTALRIEELEERVQVGVICST